MACSNVLLLLLLSSCRELLQLLLPPILGVDAAKAAAAAPGEVLSTLTDSHVGRLLRDECYSHLLEVKSRCVHFVCLSMLEGLSWVSVVMKKRNTHILCAVAHPVSSAREGAGHANRLACGAAAAR
jgi:hypothetical protein